MNRWKLIQVIVSESERGEGTPNNPVRLINQFWSVDGRLLAEADPMSPDTHSLLCGNPFEDGK
jgi:hypothetical protein